MHSLKYSHLVFIIFCFSIAGKSQNLGGNPASQKWQQINSNAVRVIFPNGLDSQANRIHNVVKMLDTATLQTIGSNSRKWNIVLLNQTTLSNAYVRLAPVISELYLTPDQNNFSSGSLRWDDNLIIHENRHMQQFSNFNKGLTKVFSFILGQEGQLLANGIAIPDYFFEGDAVWQETLVSKQGRGRMPSFFNGMKTLELANKKYSWMKLRSGSIKSYLPDHYQLGYQLVAYGYEKYGDDFWRKVTEDAVRFKGIFYSFNNAIAKYSGISYQQFTKDAILYFKEKLLSSNQNNVDESSYITAVKKNNVVDYLFPAFVNDDTILVTKQSYNELNSFYLIIKDKEKKLRVKDYVTDDYFSYRNGNVVYAAYVSDPVRANRNYSDIRLLNIYSNRQTKLTNKCKYFSPDINAEGTEIIAVNVNPDGSNFLHRLDAATGKLISEIPNPNNYFFTQTKFINSEEAVSAVRHPDGRMALVKINLKNGETLALTEFTYQVLGYPFVKNNTVYYSMMDYTGNNKFDRSKIISDKVFALDLQTMKNFQLTENGNGIYQPIVNNRGDVVVATFTADGYRLEKFEKEKLLWKETNKSVASVSEVIGIAAKQNGAFSLYSLKDSSIAASSFKKSFRLFNFHSARPFVADPEFGYTIYGDNVLSTFSNNISYQYNRNEQSSTIGYNAVFAGVFPFLTTGLEYSYNRNIDTAIGKGINFNSAKASIGFSVPLSFIGGKTFKYFNAGASYNIEQIPYIGIGKDVFANKAFKYTNAFLSFSNASRQAKQNFNPGWAQSVSLNFRQGYSFFNTRKLIANSAFYFPGLFKNHSLVMNIAFQSRDTTQDLFSNNFSYSRGYGALNTRRMYKLGVNYHFPLLYPDWGFGNIIFFQRIRANTFFDYTNAKARVNGVLTEIINRSTGGEIYFDTKIWNALPFNFGIRYSHLLDTDLRNPATVGRWEIILPINLIPN